MTQGVFSSAKDCPFFDPFREAPLGPVQFERVDAEGGVVILRDSQCSFTYHRPRPGVIIVVIRGRDTGQFGTGTVDELRRDLEIYAPVELFFDTSDVGAPATVVSEHWTEWLRDNRYALKSVSILVRSKFMHLTMEIAKLLSRTGEVIRVYLDPAYFEEALGRTVPGFRLPTTDRAE